MQYEVAVRFLPGYDKLSRIPHIAGHTEVAENSWAVIVELRSGSRYAVAYVEGLRMVPGATFPLYIGPNLVAEIDVVRSLGEQS